MTGKFTFRDPILSIDGKKKLSYIR